MTRVVQIVIVAVALFLSAHRLPAPIAEESPTPASTAKPTPQATVKRKPTPLSWAGRWQVGYGDNHVYEMQLSQTGHHVNGTYTNPYEGGVVDGTISGKILSGTYTGTHYHGVFRLSLSGDGKSFSGTWTSSYGTGGPWTGQRQ